MLSETNHRLILVFACFCLSKLVRESMTKTKRKFQSCSWNYSRFCSLLLSFSCSFFCCVCIAFLSSFFLFFHCSNCPLSCVVLFYSTCVMSCLFSCVSSPLSVVLRSSWSRGCVASQCSGASVWPLFWPTRWCVYLLVPTMLCCVSCPRLFKFPFTGQVLAVSYFQRCTGSRIMCWRSTT